MISRDDLNKWRFNVYINVFCYVYNVRSVCMIAIICLKICVYCMKILRLSWDSSKIGPWSIFSCLKHRNDVRSGKPHRFIVIYWIYWHVISHSSKKNQSTCIAPCMVQTTLKRAGMDHTAFNLQRTPCLTLPRKRSPNGTSTECGGKHLIAAHYSFIDPERMKGWVGLVGWPIANGLPT